MQNIVKGVLGDLNLKNYENLITEFNRDEINLKSFKKSRPKESYWRLKLNNYVYDIIKFTTPKRTRSFPFARVFDILFSNNRKIAMIPIAKDEREQVDFLGLETVAILNAFQVYVIISYYNDSEMKIYKGIVKPTNQSLDFEYCAEQLIEIDKNDYGVIEWNQKQVKNYANILKKAEESYKEIEIKLKMKKNTLPSVRNIPNHLKRIEEEGFEEYLKWRDRNKRVSQKSELSTIQPKEDVIQKHSGIPLDISFQDNLGFKYPLQFHTAPDETWFIENNIFFIEKKRNKSKPNIVESVFRDIIYKNLKFQEKLEYKIHFGIGITYDKYSGVCFSRCKNFPKCLSENFEKCYDETLKILNSNDTIHKQNFSLKVLEHCNKNEHNLFIIGKKNLDADESNIEKYILKKLIAGK
ncbi:MAG: hypothetical protein ACTSRG_19535 [Candidatus Helarchaeota archaeon]